MRISELLNLKPENYYPDSNILVFESLKQGGKKAAVKRQVPLTRRLKKLLNQFFNSGGIPKMPPITAEKMLERLGKRAGIARKVTPHILRHSYAVNSLLKGTDIVTLQRRLGHSKLDTTAIYLKYVPDSKRGI